LAKLSANNVQKTRDAELANAQLMHITTYNDRALQRMAEAFMQSLAHLLVAGSKAFVYAYAWRVKSAGIGVKEADATAEETRESILTFQNSPKPLVRVPDTNAPDGWRIVTHADVCGADPPGYIKRCFVTARLSDVQRAERYLHILLRHDVPGFRGNIMEGGTGKMGGSHLYGGSVLVIPSGLTAMGIAVRDDYCKALAAACTPNGGRRAGIKLPALPPGPFLPKDARGGFVLGASVMHAARGLKPL
jgi:hypothetical protein